MLDAQMKSLEARINSHFLFNTLESINSMAELDDNDQIATMSLALGNMFRFTLKTQSELVTVREELGNVQDYVSIQQIRFDYRFRLIMDMADAFKEQRILKLILQPLVENALYHGLKYCSCGDLITITGRLDGRYLYIDVKDNGQGMEEEQLLALQEMLNKEADGAITSEKLKFINHTRQLILLTLYSCDQFCGLDIPDWLTEGGFGDLALYLSNSTQPKTGFLILFLPPGKDVKAESLVKQITEALLTLAQLNDPALCSYVYNDAITPRQIVWENEDKFLFYVKAAKQDEISQLTEQLFNWFSSIPSFTLSDAKYYCYYLSNQCKNILNYYLEQNNTKSSASVQNVVSRLFRIEELKEYYLQFFLNIAEMLRPRSIYGQEDVIENVQVYMQHNYQKSLTQDFIASLFYLNRSYLSTLFKQRTGMKFIDYLNDIRIGKAAELLKNSDRKMYQISKAVGYDNPKYFFRIFKKKMGCSPEQYRKEYES